MNCKSFVKITQPRSTLVSFEVYKEYYIVFISFVLMYYNNTHKAFSPSESEIAITSTVHIISVIVPAHIRQLRPVRTKWVLSRANSFQLWIDSLCSHCRIKMVFLRSVHTTPQLHWVAAIHTNVMLLHCRVTWKLNSF